MKKVFVDAFAIFLEGLTPATLLAAFMMATIGIIFRLVLGATNRDPKSERSPEHFSWKFLISDNAIRIYKGVVATILALFLSLRFADYFIGKALGPKFTMLYALMLGFGIDFVIERWKAIRIKIGQVFSSKKINDDI